MNEFLLFVCLYRCCKQWRAEEGAGVRRTAPGIQPGGIQPPSFLLKV